MAGIGRLDGRGRDERHHPFLARMRALTDLDEGDLAAVSALLGEPRALRSKAEIARDAAGTDRLHVLLDGWACRFHLLADGRRQIVALLLPGDICDLDAFFTVRRSVGLATLTSCTVAPVGIADLRGLAAERPAVADALGRLLAIDNTILAECIACLGRRSAREQLAHLLCTLRVRLDAIGRVHRGGFDLPITQEEIADVLGLTSVHVNRVLQALRGDGSIRQEGHRITIGNRAALAREAGFRPDHLFLPDDAERWPSELDAPSPIRVLP